MAKKSLEFKGYNSRIFNSVTDWGKDERLVNCFRVKDGDRQYFIKRPGWAIFSTYATGKEADSAGIVWTGKSPGDNIIVGAHTGGNSTIYKVDNTATATSLGAITGTASHISETVVGGNATVVVVSSDNTLWYYDAGATVAVMTKVADADYPGNAGLTIVGGMVHMDGYAFVMDSTGRIWNSDVNSITAWTSTSFIDCSAYPDLGSGVRRVKNQILGFGPESMQAFYNFGNATGSPLSRIDTSTARVGLGNSLAITAISDSLFFVGQIPSGGPSFFKYDGALSRIGTPVIDNYLRANGLTAARLIGVTSLRFFGRSFVIILIGVSNSTYLNHLAYCVEEKEWFEISYSSGIGQIISTRSDNNQLSFFPSGSSLNYFTPTATVYTDGGQAFTATMQTGFDDFGTSNRKFYNELSVVADIAASTSTLTIAVCDDDSANYTTIGTVDLSSNFPLMRCGASNPSKGNKRSWRATHSANLQFRIERFELPNVQIGNK